MSEYQYRNKRTGTEYVNLGRALDEAEDQEDIERVGSMGKDKQ